MNFVLNPEAPEFNPQLSKVTENGYTTVKNTIKSSNHFPVNPNINRFKIFTDFDVVTCKIRENVLIQTNNISKSQRPSVKLKLQEEEHNMDKIVNVNDHCLDRVNMKIDSVVDPKTSTETVWNNQPVITKIKVGSTMFLGTKNIMRPQINFKNPIDNTEKLWVPIISDKPNNIKPLTLNIFYNDKGEPVGYEHPYKVELGLYKPPQHFIDADPHTLTFPLSLEETKLTFIDTEEHVDELVLHLETVEELAVDVEHHSYRTYQGITCLIQISTIEGDFIIDALAVREHIHKLNISFTNPKKLKIFHGAESDVLWLQRDFGVYIVGMFDTHQAARALNLPELSLKSLLQRYCGVKADKRYQLADWRIRPLPDELIQYARMDTHYLLFIWRTLKGELLDMGEQTLISVFNRSRHICGMTYNKEIVTDKSHLSVYIKSKKTFNSQQMAALRLLYKWRDSHARELDESTMYLLPNHMMLLLAEVLPRDVQGVAACCVPASPFIKQNLVAVHRMLLSCRELPLEPQLNPKPLAAVMSYPSVSPQNVHDMTHFPEYKHNNVTPGSALLDTATAVTSDLPVFQKQCSDGKIVSELNVEAKMFIPPYERYRNYRSLAQVEEIKEYRDKEAKIAALSKGYQLIKTEVLLKLQQETKTLKEKDEQNKEINENIILINKDKNKPTERSPSPETSQRKRKISNYKLKKEENKDQVKDKNEQLNPNPFNYTNVNYGKFKNEDKPHQQPKMKFKKQLF